jgi:hypothetical protein
VGHPPLIDRPAAMRAIDHELMPYLKDPDFIALTSIGMANSVISVPAVKSCGEPTLYELAITSLCWSLIRISNV